jgi:hypothetical protein
MKTSVWNDLLHKFWPVARMQRIDEIYDSGKAIEVVIPGRSFSRAHAIDDHSLLVEDEGEEHVMILPAAVERGSLRIERYGDLALLCFQKLPQFTAAARAVGLPQGAAGVLR